MTTALAVSGLPAEKFCFEGFAPRRKSARRTWLASLDDERRTCVFFESPRRLAACLRYAVEQLGGAPGRLSSGSDQSARGGGAGTLDEATWAAGGVRRDHRGIGRRDPAHRPAGAVAEREELIAVVCAPRTPAAWSPGIATCARASSTKRPCGPVKRTEEDDYSVVSARVERVDQRGMHTFGGPGNCICCRDTDGSAGSGGSE